MSPGVYCFRDAPHQRGDLWVRVRKKTVKILSPTSEYWRGRVIKIEDFLKEVKHGQG
jgi:hypothetical protein